MLPLHVLLADENPTFLRAAADWLGMLPLLAVVGQARTGLATLALVQQLSPNLVLIGWSLRDMRGIEVAPRIKALPLTVKVIIMGLDDLPAYRAAAAASGADGFIAKSELAGQFLPLIRGLFEDG